MTETLTIKVKKRKVKKCLMLAPVDTLNGTWTFHHEGKRGKYNAMDIKFKKLPNGTYGTAEIVLKMPTGFFHGQKWEFLCPPIRALQDRHNDITYKYDKPNEMTLIVNFNGGDNETPYFLFFGRYKNNSGKWKDVYSDPTLTIQKI